MRDFSGSGRHPPQSANTPLPSTRNHQDGPNHQGESSTVLERCQALKPTIRNLSDEMHSYYQSIAIAQSLHWLDDVIHRIDPAAARASSASKPPLVPLDTSSHRGGGGPKQDRALQKAVPRRASSSNGLAATEPSRAL
ncbi:uncharacterized protein UMAG_11579 [Mycosarcoma maydis]|uniref:Uncharacterized protein n=1 Tax=Mycosarcoma maydis TaxID=5270 RepID=A0A0D1CHN2_MYCMD|nr:uncharacterized protein UMAG_11579 [Ustilago maydis 521]KIS66468.1 hypothetical protein UMAG_11579 [Ustilago maydis 521]|eukprot:XP_011391956.1 hypothetical protein UMAG_11579 [Ustilago maydis 521]